MTQETHTKDHKKVSLKLPVSITVFLAIVIIGFVTMKAPKRVFIISVDEMHQIILDNKDVIKPQDAYKIEKSNDEKYRFIDLRNPQDFLISHIEGAINAPQQHILSNEFAYLFKDTTTTNILYSNNYDATCGPWMILKQLGYNNNKILLGGYKYYNNISDTIKNKQSYMDEKPRYDYAKIVKSTAGSSIGSSSAKKKKFLGKRKKKKKGAEGGCI